ncbi:hypothetical protein Lepto7375DRAFT_1023 [Leptolyngbya sp. PCC 7375]|nr:hypothetical protein Lepto7375DRAFT_1023 [Leptolyngbya sp. PCC 7375]
MESPLVFLGILLLAGWLLRQLFPENNQPVGSLIDSAEGTDPLIEATDSRSDVSELQRELMISRREAAREKALDRDALLKLTHIENTSTEPDEEGFVAPRTRRQDTFLVRTNDGHVYRGRIKLGHETMFTIKVNGFRPRLITLDFRDVEKLE